MERHRTTARGASFLTCVLLTGALWSWTGAAGAAPAPAVSAAQGAVPRLVFPVLGTSRYTDDFGEARGQGGHEGNDIVAPKRALALAAEAGRISFRTTSSRAGCMLYLNGESGTQYLYIHLNNDLTLENDNRGTCVPGVAYAQGLKDGAKVAAGQAIAYVGDSGDADGGGSHLHFEVHPDGGGAVSPYRYLQKARRLLFAATPGSTFTLALTGEVLFAGRDALELSLDQVRQWPGGRRTMQAGQKVAVTIPETAAVVGVAPADGLVFSALQLLTRGLPVTVWTEPAKVTLAAQSGAKGALAAARVVVKR
jgi:Peptidase family M23